MTDVNTRRLLAFCPYLTLSKPHVFGRWTLSPLDHPSVAFDDEEFEAGARQFLSRFVDVDRTPIKNPSILWESGKRIDGASPTPGDLRSLDAALRFSSYDRNPRYREAKRGPGGHSVTTADHGEVFLWPIDIATKHVTIARGSDLLHLLDGGWTYDDDDLQIHPPLELVMPPGTVALDEELLGAVLAVALIAETPGHPQQARATQVLTASEWCNKAWLNSARFTFADRIVMLKVGFEALTDEEKSHRQAPVILHAFERLGARGDDPTDELLWRRADATRYPRTRPRSNPPVTEQWDPLGHWFMAFADCRNQILHQGIVSSRTYTMAGSAFEGHFFWVGEWILRKAIKVALEEFGFVGLWRSPSNRVWDRMKADAMKSV